MRHIYSAEGGIGGICSEKGIVKGGIGMKQRIRSRMISLLMVASMILMTFGGNYVGVYAGAADGSNAPDAEEVQAPETEVSPEAELVPETEGVLEPETSASISGTITIAADVTFGGGGCNLFLSFFESEDGSGGAISNCGQMIASTLDLSTLQQPWQVPATAKSVRIQFQSAGQEISAFSVLGATGNVDYNTLDNPGVVFKLDHQGNAIVINANVVKQGGNPGPGGPGQGSETAAVTLNLSGYNNPDPYIDSPVGISINGGPGTPLIPGQATNVSYDPDPSDPTKLHIDLAYILLWAPNVITINGDSKIGGSRPTNAELIGCYAGQAYHFEYDIDAASAITVDSTIEELRGDCPVGNFLWSYTDPQADDDYISHAKLDILSVTYQGETITTPGGSTRSFGGANEWKSDSSEGSATLPAGATLRVRLTPEYGYQLVSFGVNGGTFAPQETPCEYTFTVGNGNFHLGANFQPVENAVSASASAVDGGSVTLGGNEASMAAGTARLDVQDASVSASVKASMESAASGYTINDVLDISLFNTIYKGSAQATWDTPVTDLSNPATITMQLANAPEGDTVALVHEKHDGSMELIDATYDPETKSVTFQTDSFSKYAIAVKSEEDAVDSAAVSDVIENLYKGILGRSSEEEGKKDWAKKVADREVSGAELIAGFVNSPEFAAKNTTNEEYVKALYSAFFQRDPSAEEVKYWTDKIASGTPRSEVMAGFVNSEEYTNTCEKMNVSRGTMEADGSVKYNKGVYQFVQRCYAKGLDRKGETKGVEDWTYRINSKDTTPKEVAESFLHSEEFKNKQLNDEEYVKVLYRMFLGREAEEEGLNYWLNELKSRSRDDIVSGFSDSPEFGGIMESFGI